MCTKHHSPPGTYIRLVSAFSLAWLLAGCSPQPTPEGEDDQPPQLTLSALGSPRTPTFSSAEGADAPIDACAKTRAFPALLSVSAADSGGIANLAIRIFGAEATDISISPTTAEWTTLRTASTQQIRISTRAPAGSIQPNVIATFSVSNLAAIRASATDGAENATDLYQVTIRAPDDAVLCRNELANQ